MAKEELLFRLSLLEQKSNQIGEQVEAVEGKIIDLEVLKNNLDEINASKSKEFLANLGEGIFIKSEIKDKDVLVNIGNKVVVKKKIEQAKEIINSQVERLAMLRQELGKEVEKINIEFKKMIDEAEKES